MLAVEYFFGCSCCVPISSELKQSLGKKASKTQAAHETYKSQEAHKTYKVKEVSWVYKS